MDIADRIKVMPARSKLLLAVLSAISVVALILIFSTAGDLSFLDRGDLSLFQDDDTSHEHIMAVVSAHELATNAGFEILEKGGTSADAAVAVAAVLSVVEPWFSSVLGGGTWALYYEADTNTVTSLDGVGPAGSKVTVPDYSERAGDPGMHQAIVPGAWDGWMLWMDEYGRLDLGEVLAPAIRIARGGFPMSADMEGWLNSQAEETLARPDTAKIYAPEGRLLQEGDTVYQEDMALTFEELVRAYDEALVEGRSEAIRAVRDHFYRGPIAEKIIEFSDKGNGYLTLSDLNDFSAEIVDPVSIFYRDNIEVFQNPPNSQGMTMLLALNILKGYDFSGLSSTDADAIHMQVEAIKLAFTDRYHHMGDPKRVNVPVEGLMSESHADMQRERINMEEAMVWPIRDGYVDIDTDLGNTTTFHIVDSEGNGAAVTTSLGTQFFVIGDTGIHINHRMRFFEIEEGNPNQATPGYKVRHTSNPYMAFKDGDLYILGGNTGADSQPQIQTQQFLNVVEFGMSAQGSIGHPRFLSTAFPATIYPYRVRNTLQMEEGFSTDLIEELERRGHDISVGEGVWGSGGMIVIEKGGRDADVGAESRSDVSYGEKGSGN